MDFMAMMRQAKQMQEKMEHLQAEFADIEVTGSAGGSMVEVTLTVLGDLKHVKIHPSLMKSEEVHVLEDLIMAAHADARRKAQHARADKMQALASSLNLPPDKPSS